MKAISPKHLGFLIRRKHFRLIFVAILLIALLLFYGLSTQLLGIYSAQAAVPQLINFQGKLTQVSDGTNIANGSYAFRFKLYDALTVGNLLWTETYDQPSGVCAKLVVTNGVFNAKLGSCGSPNALSGVDFTSNSLYLSIDFAPTGVAYDGEMAPRKQFVATPYALNANNVTGDGRIDIAYAPANATNPAASIAYNPSVSSSKNALTVSNNSSATGTTLIVTTGGTGAGIELAGAGASARVIKSDSAALVLRTTTSGNITLDPQTGIVAGQAALTLQSGGANTLTVDTGGAAGLNLGTGNANAVAISKTGIATTIQGTITFNEPATVGNGSGNDYLGFAAEGTNPTCAAGNYRVWANSTDLKLKKCQNGTISDLDTTGSSTLQSAYDATSGNTITTTNARDISITLADTATDSNFLINIATSSTSKFAVQSNATDVFTVTSSAITLAADTTLSAGKVLSAASGTGAFDFSLASGIFKTSTGAVTIGPGTTTLSGTAINLTGTSPVIDLTSATTLSINTTTNRPVTFGSGLVTTNGALTATGLITANGGLTVAGGQNLVLSSGAGQLQQTFTTAGAVDASAITYALTNSGAGVTSSGLVLTPTNNTVPSSGVNTLNVINFPAGTGGNAADRTTNGLNFASATGYKNFLNSPSIVINSSGAITGATGVASSGTITFSGLTASRALFTDGSSNLAVSGASAALLNALTDETGTGVAVFSTSPTFTTGITFTAAGSITSGGANALTVDAGGAAALNLGNTNATSLVLGNTTNTATIGINTSATTATGVTLTANGVTTGTGLLVTDSANLNGAGILAKISAANATSGVVLNVAGGSAMTTGSDLDINGATYVHTTLNEIGSLAKLTFTDASSNANNGGTTNGLNISPTINTTGAGTKTINGLNVAAPAFGANNCTDGACSYNGIKVTGGSASNVTNIALYANAGSGGGTNYAAAFMNGNVGVGNSAPAATLDIDSNSITSGTSFDVSSTSVTSGTFINLVQNTSAFTGTGIKANFASGSGSFNGNFLDFQSNSISKFLVGSQGNLTINVATSDLVKTTTGTINSTDFSLSGSTLTNVTDTDNTVSLNDGTVPASGQGTMSTSTVVTAVAVGAGGHTFLRDDGQLVIVHGGNALTCSRWDGSSATMTSVTCATGATGVGAGAIVLRRPDGRYLIIHAAGSAGSPTALTSLFDPWGITALAAGTAIPCTNAGAGTNAFLRADGKYVVLCGGQIQWFTYNPVAGTYSAVQSVGAGLTFGAGAHAIQRDDGTFLVFRGANTTTHWIYNPFASATGTMTQDPITTSPPTITTGAFSIRRNDGKFLVMGGAINASTIYDPTPTSANSGAGSMTAQTVQAGDGPTVALGDAAQALWREDGKYLLIIGGASTVTNIIDPSKGLNDTTQFTSGPTLNAALGAGGHLIPRPDGRYQIIRGGASTTTDIYDMGFIMGGDIPTALTAAAPSAGGLVTLGTHSWKVTFVSQASGESSAGTVSNQVNVTTGSTQTVALSAVPIGPPGTTARKIYRTVAGDTGNYLLLTTLSDNSTTIFSDTIADASLGAAVGAGQGAIYETECMTSSSLSISSTLNWNANQEGYVSFRVRTGTSCPLGGSYKDIINSGDLINPASGDTKIQVRAFFRRDFPNFVSQEWKIWRGLSQTRYRRRLMDPALYDFTIDNTSLLHRNQFDFGIGVNNTATDPSGPANVNTVNDPGVGVALAQGYGADIPGFGASINATDPHIYNGVVGTHPALVTSVSTLGTVVMRRPNGTFLIISGSVTANAQLYDPVAGTITAQSGSGIPTAGTGNVTLGSGALALKRPDGKFLVVLGNAVTTTNIYDPVANTFTAGPALTAAAGPGSALIPLPNGRILIIHGNVSSTTSIYDPIQNTMVAGPVPSAVANFGSLVIPRPDGTYLVILGMTSACATTATVTNNFDPYTMTFTAAGSPATTITGPGAFAFQRSDGQWVIMDGGGTVTSCAATTRTEIYNPITNKLIVGPVTSAAVYEGGTAMQRPDGTWLITHGNNLTSTSIYREKIGAFTANGLAGIGDFIAGPTLVTAVGVAPGSSISGTTFQRDDGKYVIISGNNTTAVQMYDAGWVASGYYRTDQMNISDLSSSSVLIWKAQGSMKGISAEVRTATSQLLLQTAAARNITSSGGFINPGAGKTWVQIHFNFKRSFPSAPGVNSDVWLGNGGSAQPYPIRQISTPILTEFKITKDVNILDLRSDSNSQFRVSSSGDIFTSNSGAVYSGGADLAERYTSDEDLQAGDVVAIDSKYGHGVKRSTYQYQNNLLGVVSTSPGFVAGAYTQNSYPIALVGRVPVKVSLENGDISVGDALTSSSIPGLAMKATKHGLIIGRALENYNSYSTGNKIMAFVNTQEYSGAERSMSEVAGDVLASAQALMQKAAQSAVAASTATVGAVQEQIVKAYDKIVAKIAVVEQLFSKRITLTPGGSLTLPAGDNQIAGHGVIKAGEFYAEIANSQVTKDSKIIVSPKITLSSPLAVSQIKDGQGFIVQLDSRADTDIPFDWIIFQTYDAASLTDASEVNISSNNNPVTVKDGQGLTTDSGLATSDFVLPKLEPKTIKLDTLTAANTGDVKVVLSGDGSFLVSTNSGQTLMTIDNSGNVVFSGPLTAEFLKTNTLVVDDIQSPVLDDLANQLFDAQASLDDLQITLDQLSADFADYQTATDQTVNDTQDQLQKLTTSWTSIFDDSGGMTITGQSMLKGGLVVDAISSLTDAISFQNDVLFIGRPYFTTDTAGFALIKQGAQSVDVTFDKEYLEQPIINASITLNDDPSLKTETDQQKIQTLRDQQVQAAQNLFASAIQYIVINKSEKGFTIVLNKPLTQDINFSWIALAVKSAKTFSSIPTSSDSTVGGVGTPTTSVGEVQAPASGTSSAPTPQVAGDSTSAPAANDNQANNTNPATTPPPTPSPTLTPSIGTPPVPAPTPADTSPATTSSDTSTSVNP